MLNRFIDMKPITLRPNSSGKRPGGTPKYSMYMNDAFVTNTMSTLVESAIASA